MKRKSLLKDVIIIGTGGHAKVVADIIISVGDNIVGFLTNDCNINTFMERPVLGNDDEWKRYADKWFVIAIGNPDVREKISKSMQSVKWYTAIHQTAAVSNIHTSIGAGTVVMANAVINSYAQIGEHCIINSGAVVEHDNIIEDYAHISVGTKLAGTVWIGKKTWIGIGATVINGIHICQNCMIGAGAVVVRNIENSGTYTGIPATKIK